MVVRMTKLLEKVFEGLSKLPDAEQDAAAMILLEEIEKEDRWSAAFDESKDELDRLAEEALAEDRASKTLPVDPGEMK